MVKTALRFLSPLEQLKKFKALLKCLNPVTSNASVISHSLRPPGQIQLYMGTFRGFEQSFYPAGGGNEGGLVSRKTGDFIKELGQFQVVLHQ